MKWFTLLTVALPLAQALPATFKSGNNDICQKLNTVDEMLDALPQYLHQVRHDGGDQSSNSVIQKIDAAQPLIEKSQNMIQSELKGKCQEQSQDTKALDRRQQTTLEDFVSATTQYNTNYTCMYCDIGDLWLLTDLKLQLRVLLQLLADLLNGGGSGGGWIGILSFMRSSISI